MKKLWLLLMPVWLLAVPNAPSELSLIPSTDAVLLSWKDNSNNERGFKIYRDGIKIHTTTKNVTGYHDRGLQPYTTYTYEVKATDDYLWYQPDSNSSWQYQLTETINQNYDVEIYDIDLYDTDIATIQALQDSGKKVICYFSAGSYEDWRSDAEDFPLVTLGNDLDGWEGEKWLDIRSSALHPIMIERLELAKQKGCDGVEADNVDGYNNNTGFDLSAEDQLAYNKFLAYEAHQRGLSIGLKNDLEQIVALEPFFDFAVNEQCHAYQECDMLNPFIYADKPVLHVEYEDIYVNNTNGARDIMCNDSTVLDFQTVILPNLLDDTFRDACHHVDSNATLLFSSGFEEGVSLSVEDEDGYQKIVGSDIAPYSWPIDILGSSESALHYIENIGPDNERLQNTKIVSVPGHDGSQTKALYSEQNGTTLPVDESVTQVPYEIFNTQANKDLYISYWIKLDSASLTKANMWRTFFEYKTEHYDDEDSATENGFRLIAYIYSGDDGMPYWHWQGDESPNSEIWSIDNREVPVPLDEWFFTEFYWHWGEGTDGRALWKVNGKVIGYKRGATTINGKDLDFIMLTQIYGNATPKHQWVDDIEIWDGLPQR